MKKAEDEKMRRSKQTKKWMNTFLTIWTKPRETFDYLLTKEKDELEFYLNALFFLGALTVAIPLMARSANITTFFDFFFFVVELFTVSFLGLLVFKYFFVYIFWKIGNILGGEASMFQVRLVMAYTLIPSLLILTIFLILIVVAVTTNDISVIANQNQSSMFIISIMGSHIMILGIAKFNKFTFGYTMINIFLAITLLQGLRVILNYFIKSYF